MRPGEKLGKSMPGKSPTQCFKAFEASAAATRPPATPASSRQKCSLKLTAWTVWYPTAALVTWGVFYPAAFADAVHSGMCPSCLQATDQPISAVLHRTPLVEASSEKQDSGSPSAALPHGSVLGPGESHKVAPFKLCFFRIATWHGNCKHLASATNATSVTAPGKAPGTARSVEVSC